MRLYQKCKLLLLLQDYTDITNATCKFLLLSCKIRWKMKTANRCCYCKMIPKIASAIARLYLKCLLQIATFTKCCCHCKALLNLHIGNYSWNSKKYFESQCHLNSIPCFPSVRSTKEQRLLQCSNIFTIYIYIFSSYNTKFWLFWF